MRPPTLWALIDGTALRRPVAEPAVMHAQLDHLIRMVRRPMVKLLVVPGLAPLMSAWPGRFAIAEFREASDTAYLDTAVQEQITDHPSGNCVEVARNLRGVVAVRDSKDPDGPVLLFTAEQWQRYTAARVSNTA